ncbi:unnamed protein product [Chironomus riparius]|uniref:Uncharacterized protein n=1 Tax=Chironomus riparius TaxID=315576 RepID=A0A9N9RUB7_9DIPT|nr:unnamed protein product [Chironomus riparius]
MSGSSSEHNNVESIIIRAKKSTPFIICNIFLERYCTSGVLAIMPLFLYNKMQLDKNLSTSIFHLYEGMTLLFTVFGAILADVWLGLYKSIIIMSCFYMFGLAIISIAMIDFLNLPLEAFVIIGLIIMAIGCGCIKGNTNVFGGNQHKLPEEERQLQTFFSSQYFALKCGSLLARFTMPILREDVKCLGKNDCYTLTFGVPAIMLFCALLVLLMGSRYYLHVPSNGNVFLKVLKCIKYALIERRRQKKAGNKINQHWLKYASEKYGHKLVLETKIVLKVLIMYLPVPMFWALHMQQSSRWIFQATKMNGDIGFYKIKPDQMIVFNSVLVILLIPLFDRFVYPFMEKIGIKSMLHRMMVGYTCTIFAFIISAFLEVQVEKNYISMLWQIPQFSVIATAEIFSYLAHLNFAYKEAPASMKPVMVAFMYLSIAAGDFIVAIISGISIFKSQAYEYLFFASLMAIDVTILGLLTRKYKYTDHEMIKTLEEVDSKNIILKNKASP